MRRAVGPLAWRGLGGNGPLADPGQSVSRWWALPSAAPPLVVWNRRGPLSTLPTLPQGVPLRQVLAFQGATPSFAASHSADCATKFHSFITYGSLSHRQLCKIHKERQWQQWTVSKHERSFCPNLEGA